MVILDGEETWSVSDYDLANFDGLNNLDIEAAVMYESAHVLGLRGHPLFGTLNGYQPERSLSANDISIFTDAGYELRPTGGGGQPPDVDQDGIPDVADTCPATPGFVSLAGCPDSDGDGIADPSDGCPYDAGPSYYSGCPADDDIMLIRPDAGKFDFYFETNESTPHESTMLNWGLPGDEFFVGEFGDAGGTDVDEDILLVGQRPTGKFDFFFNTDEATPHEAVINNWGQSADQFLVGDLDGAGVDDVILVRFDGSKFDFFARDLERTSDIEIHNWGIAGDEFLIGDFDGNPNDDDIVLVRFDGSKFDFYFETNNATPHNSTMMNWGIAGDEFYVGEFGDDGGTDADEDILLVRENANGKFYFYFDYDEATPHEAVISNWGQSGDQIRIADVDGNGIDDVILVRFDGSKFGFYAREIGRADIEMHNWGLTGDQFLVGEFG